MLSSENYAIDLIKTARQVFIQSDKYPVKSLNGPVKLFSKKINGETYRVFGVKKDDQKEIDFDKLRQEISYELAFNKTQTFVQIIGDSNCFGQQETDFCRRYLSEYLEHDKECIVLYGFTGNLSDDGNRADTNALLAEWLDQHPERANNVIANVVDEHTITAIEKWGCTVSSNVKNYFLVYTDELTPTVKFGDDTPSSDGLSNKACCLRGGVLSLRQILAMLNDNVLINCVVGLRSEGL
ncbi:MAG: hypothetical protein ABI597_03520 [Gammaproteobacteria bacterium]